MGFQNPPVPWSRFEALLAGNRPPGADGGDAPAWSARRQPYRPPPAARRRPPGGVRFAEAARAVGLPTVFGAELTLLPPGGGQRTGTPDPAGEHLLVLARDPAGYALLCRAISEAQMAGSKGAPRGSLGRLAGLHGGHWLVLTGCRKGAVPEALHERGPAAAAAE